MTSKEAVVVSWTGMRGVVTIAAAAGIPLLTIAGDPFPGRALIQAVAFTVAVGTLLLQGATLPALIRRVGLPNDDARRRSDSEKVALVATEAAGKVMGEFARNPPEGIDARMLAQMRVIAERRSEESTDTTTSDPRDSPVFDDLMQTLLQAQRAAVLDHRDRGALDPDAVSALVERLDYQEAAVVTRQANRL